MHGNDNVGQEMASGAYDSHPPLPKLQMNRIIQQSRSRVPHQRRQKDEGNNNKSKMIVLLQLDQELVLTKPHFQTPKDQDGEQEHIHKESRPKTRN